MTNPGDDPTELDVHPSDGEVVEGEVISDEEWERVRHREAALARWQGYAYDTRAVIRVTRQAATHDRTRAVVRHVAYVPAGVWVLARHAWEATSCAEGRAQLRNAKAMGNVEDIKHWATFLETAKQGRHKRMMDLLHLPATLIRASAQALAGLAATLVGVGILLAIANEDITWVLAPAKAVLAGLAFLVWIGVLAWGWLVLVAPALALWGLYCLGRSSGVTLGWLQTSADGDIDITIDETTIALALGALRIPQITAYLKEGHPLQFLTPCRVDGRGTHCVVRLVRGVTAEKVARRRADLATGLHRLAKEVWPTTGAEAGILDLWIADKGALAEGAGPYPLLDEGVVDVFKGVPFGKQLRGTPIVAPLMERNTIAGGIPGQGKSSAARCIMAGAALDPTAELRIWVPDANFDFEAFRPRCSRYVMGAENERIEEILLDLRELHAEVQARGQLLIQYETPAVTRELANQGVGLHPLFCLLEEAHVAISHKEYGKEIAQLLVEIVRLGRKRGIHLMVSTQAPTKDSIPRDVTRNCSNGIAFAVGDHVANDALLGQGAYRAGHRATELIPGADAGTAVVKGFTGERSEIVQVYFICVDREDARGDQITPIIARAMAAIARRKTGVPGSARVRVEPRDLLGDVQQVMDHEEKVNAADVPARLRVLAPEYLPYRALKGNQLSAQLRDLGCEVKALKGTETIRLSLVNQAIEERGW